MTRFVEQTPDGQGWLAGGYRFTVGNDGTLYRQYPGGALEVVADASVTNTSITNTVSYADGGTSAIDASAGVFFALTANGASTTIAVSNVPTTGTRYGLELHLTWTAGAITFPASWNKGDALPSATGNYVITAVTVDGGTSFKIAVLTE